MLPPLVIWSKTELSPKKTERVCARKSWEKGNEKAQVLPLWGRENSKRSHQVIICFPKICHHNKIITDATNICSPVLKRLDWEGRRQEAIKLHSPPTCQAFLESLSSTSLGNIQNQAWGLWWLSHYTGVVTDNWWTTGGKLPPWKIHMLQQLVPKEYENITLGLERIEHLPCMSPNRLDPRHLIRYHKHHNNHP